MNTDNNSSKSFTTLFADGVHIILSYLTTCEWNAIITTGKQLYNSAQSREPCRRIEISWSTSISNAQPINNILLPSLSHSSLRRHVNSLEMVIASPSSLSTALAVSSHHKSPSTQTHLLASLSCSCLISLSHLITLSLDLNHESSLRLRVDDTNESELNTIQQIREQRKKEIESFLQQLPVLLPQLQHFSLSTPMILSICPTSLLTLASLLHLTLAGNWKYGITSGTLSLALIQLLILTQAKHLTRIDLMYAINWNSMVMKNIEAWAKVYLPQIQELAGSLSYGEGALSKLHAAFPNLTRIDMNVVIAEEIHVLKHFRQLRSLSIGQIKSQINAKSKSNAPMEVELRTAAITTLSYLVSLTSLTIDFDISHEEVRQLTRGLSNLIPSASIGSYRLGRKVNLLLSSYQPADSSSPPQYQLTAYDSLVRSTFFDQVSTFFPTAQRLFFHNILAKWPDNADLRSSFVKIKENVIIMPSLEYLQIKQDLDRNRCESFVWQRSCSNSSSNSSSSSSSSSNDQDLNHL